MSLAVLAAGAARSQEAAPVPNGRELARRRVPPGDYFLNYFGYYGGKLRTATATGEERPSAWFDALRYVHTSDFRIMAALGLAQSMPLVHQTLDLGGRPVPLLRWATSR